MGLRRCSKRIKIEATLKYEQKPGGNMEKKDRAGDHQHMSWGGPPRRDYPLVFKPSVVPIESALMPSVVVCYLSLHAGPEMTPG